MEHVDEYCNIDKYIESHQENQMEKELEKKTYYIHEKQESDIMSKEEYERIKNSLSSDSITKIIQSDGEEKVSVTNNIRILSRKKKIQDFQRIGKYTFSKDDNIFIFAKDYNNKGEAQDIKIVSFEYFDTYIEQGYNFVGVASLD